MLAMAGSDADRVEVKGSESAPQVIALTESGGGGVPDDDGVPRAVGAVHVREAKFACKMCGRPAECFQENVSHMAKHIMSFMCMLCGARFGYESELDLHTCQLQPDKHDDDGGGGGEEDDDYEEEECVATERDPARASSYLIPEDVTEVERVLVARVKGQARSDVVVGDVDDCVRQVVGDVAEPGIPVICKPDVDALLGLGLFRHERRALLQAANHPRPRPPSPTASAAAAARAPTAPASWKTPPRLRPHQLKQLLDKHFKCAHCRTEFSRKDHLTRHIKHSCRAFRLKF